MELGGESGLAAESYHSDSADAETIAHSLLARLALRRDDGWWSRLTLRHDAGLTLDDNGGSAGLGRFGERWDLELGATLTRSDEGALSTPLLLFDPDSLASRVADSQAYWRRGGVLRLDWHALDWSAALDADRSDLDYDEASDILADQRERLLATFVVNGGGTHLDRCDRNQPQNQHQDVNREPDQQRTGAGGRATRALTKIDCGIKHNPCDRVNDGTDGYQQQEDTAVDLPAIDG